MPRIEFGFILLILGVSSSELSEETTSPNENVVVRLSHGGRVRGVTLTSEKGKLFYAFIGVPYAEPPLGQLRFKPPTAKLPWEESVVFDATKDAEKCPQIHPMTKALNGQEDCLYLNVYTPKLFQNGTNGGNKSVMISIHGGGFGVGSGTYADFPPERLMDSDIVLVTINYRLHVLGFLSTSDASSPGNYGLLDQTLAFQWVKDNIEAFGGNPHSVTIFGESTGGSCISYHLISPKSKGLFQKAIAMSGSFLTTYHFEANPLKWAKRLAFETNCPQDNTTAMVECLRGKSVSELLFALDPYMTSSFFNFPFPATVDGHFITDSPRNILKYYPERINKVPLLSGCTEMEGAGIVASTEQSRPNVSVTSEESYEYLFNTSVTNHDANISHVIRDQYMKSIDITNEFEAKKAVAKAFSDSTVRMPMYEETKYYTQAGLAVYMYSYDYGTTNVVGPNGSEDRKYGVGHAEDMFMLFNITWHWSVLPLEENDHKMIGIMTDVWSSFAKTGYPDPRHAYLPQWKPSSPELFHIHHLNLSITIEDYYVKSDEKFTFWTRDVVAARNRTADSCSH